MLKDLLEQKNCFKLICGAGNENTEEVEKLVTLYAKAGCKFFDVSANTDVIKAAKKGLKNAGADGFLCVSIGLKGDPHTNKAVIDGGKCVSCYNCDNICPQNAIKYAKIKFQNCIGCGKCTKICPKHAISLESFTKPAEEILPEIIKEGIDCIELHGSKPNEITENFEKISKLYDGLISLCISRNNLGDRQIIETVKSVIKGRKPYTTIIQADGHPMTGGQDDYKTTLQAVATGEIIQNENMPVFLILSGGTNSKTKELCKMFNLEPNGIAYGSCARKIVKEFIDRDDFFTNQKIFNKALDIAKSFVQ